MSAAIDPLVSAIADAVAAKIQIPASRTKRLLTTAEAAEYLSVCGETVKRLRASGKLPSVGLLPSKLLFDVDDLDAVIVSLKERLDEA